MTLMLNPDYQLIYRKQEAGQLYFQNSLFGNLLQISEVEYDILQAYVECGDYALTAARFQDAYDFEPAFIPQLVSRAQSVDLLLNPDYTRRKEELQAKPIGRTLEIMRYLLHWLSQLTAPLQVRLTAELRGNLRFFRLLSVDFKNSLFDRFCASSVSRYLLLGLSLLLVSAASLSLAHAGFAHLAPHYLLNLSPAATAYAPLILGIGFLLSTLFHEMGHLLVYRHYGGQTSEMGLALTLGVFPVLYVTTNSLYLWDEPGRRRLVTAAGLLVDAGQVIVLTALVVQTAAPALAFYGVLFLYLVVVRMLANVNPFIPGTDGYFLLADALARPALYQSAAFAATAALTTLRHLAPQRVTRAQWVALGYMTLSVCFITLYYSLLGLMLLSRFV